MKPLPKLLLDAARDRASELGLKSVEDYIAVLIRQDVQRPLSKASLQTRSDRAVRRGEKRSSVSVLRKRLLDGMYSHMKASEDPGYGYSCGYTLRHVDRCAAITRDFIERLTAIPKGDEEKVLSAIKRVIERLNKLNASCDRALIATDQREELCELILTVAAKAGLKSRHDVTAEWREW